MRVLVTGATGLIGRVAVRELLARGHRICTLQRGPGPALPNVKAYRADTASGRARSAAAASGAVLHLAGRGDVLESWQTPLDYLKVVVGGTLNVLEGARTSGASLVMASTHRVYRPSRRPVREAGPVWPVDPYAVAKLAAEQYCRLYAERYGLATRAVRLFSVYGPGQRGRGNSGVVAIFIQRALEGQDLIVDPAPRRDLTYVDDAVYGLCQALEMARPGFAVYNVATGEGTALQTLAETVVRLTGSRSRIGPPAEPWTGGDLVADLRLARRELGYEPTVELEEGLRRTIGAPDQRLRPYVE